MQVLNLAQEEVKQENGNAEVSINHLGDRLLVTARLTEGDSASVTVRVKGKVEGQKTIELTKEKPTGGLFIKLPQGKYTLEILLNGVQVFSGELEASPYHPSSPLIPATVLAILGMWGW